MKLRPKLMPPDFPPALLDQLVGIAKQIRSSDPNDQPELVADFNLHAGTEFDRKHFHSMGAPSEHRSWIEKSLLRVAAQKQNFISEDEILELIARLLEANRYSDREVYFWIETLDSFLPDPNLQDLIHDPGKYFGDGDISRQMTPREILDAANAADDDSDLIP